MFCAHNDVRRLGYWFSNINMQFGELLLGDQLIYM
jgi:hypothetical protein